MAAIIIDCDDPTAGRGFFTLTSTDGLPHLVEITSPIAGPENPIAVQSFRAWWDTERPFAEQAAAGLLAEDARLRQLDRQRWFAIGAFAPALWGLAGGSVSALANFEAAGAGIPEPPLNWEALYELNPPAPVSVDPPLPAVTPSTDPQTIRMWVLPDANPNANRLLPAEGLVIPLESGVADVRVKVLSPSTFEIQEEFQLQTDLVRSYAKDCNDPDFLWNSFRLKDQGWSPAPRLRIADLLSTWRGGNPATSAVIVPSAGIAVEALSQRSDVPPVVRLPRWLLPKPMAALSLLAYLLAGWFIARPTANAIPWWKRLFAILLGWLACWCVSVLGLPLLGLGFIPGAVMAVYTWERFGLGTLSWQRAGAAIAFLIGWSAVCWPLFATQGLLPPG